ncbi:DEAD/DEAH box helicase [Necator americanus]|uniref:RNA helicase n=1 Tax=Necator americanus TaxID=51031 RepID=W2SF99_NECAM|nr:DEAD/DEAH box helicase [Necator americanus]ETN68203.1 DEAD/DEAH box helicase [Necator americanus]
MNSVPPPQSLTTSSGPGFVAGSYMSVRDREKKKEEEYANLMYYGAKTEKEGRKKRLYDDEYLEGEDSDDDQSSSSSSSRRRRWDEDGRSSSHRDRERDGKSSRKSKDEEPKKPAEDDEEDELDAFMAEIDAQASKDKAISVQKEKDRASGKDTDADKKGIGRADIDEEDMQESYFKYLEEHKDKIANEEEEYEYDEDGNVIWTWKKVIDPLPPIDHLAITYPEFNKVFYAEHDEISKLNHVEVVRLRERLGLRVGGFHPPKPVCSFAHFGFDKQLMDAIRKSEYEQPTPIQAQAIPAALSGRDVLGIAKTGSGKTAAYLWPAIVHIMDQRDLDVGDGPIALVVVPTRELAIQVYQEAKRFCKIYNINVICAYGGGSKWEQSNELKNEGAELVVCTPGRIIDLVKIEATNFLRTTFLVFDEADRMFDMGFEAQVKSISDHIRPDRQCLMFSATFKHKVERLARDALRDPVRIVQGEVGEANADVIQTVEVLPRQDTKWVWLTKRLVDFGTMGKVLIFVTKKVNAEDLAKKLRARDFELVLLHGDMLQHERNEHLQAFRKKVNIMVATDVAARGLDIPEIRTVVNYDLARDIDTHVHRVGRTGRAGQRGWAYTLITDKDMEMAGHLVRNLESVNQEVPQALLSLAMKSAWFRAQRQGDGSGALKPKARLGLGYKPKTRPVPGSKGAELDPLKETKPRGSSNLTVRDAIRAATSTDNVGPAGAAPSNRLLAMKNAFKQSFAATFKPSELESSKIRPQVVSDPRPEWKKKIDEINARIMAQNPQTQQTPVAAASAQSADDEGASAKKKSRWQ